MVNMEDGIKSIFKETWGNNRLIHLVPLSHVWSTTDGKKLKERDNALAPWPTHVQDVQGDDVGGGRAQLIGRLHPHLVRREQSEVAGDVAGELLLRPGATASTLCLCPVPPALRFRQITCNAGQIPKIMAGILMTDFLPLLMEDIGKVIKNSLSVRISPFLNQRSSGMFGIVGNLRTLDNPPLLFYLLSLKCFQ